MTKKINNNIEDLKGNRKEVNLRFFFNLRYPPNFVVIHDTTTSIRIDKNKISYYIQQG